MKSLAPTPAEYFAALPPDRRQHLAVVRDVLLANLDKDMQECMQYGVVAYCVPHSVWPHGHHTNPELPLMYMGLSSRKNDMAVYMLCLYQNEPMRTWFERAWKAAGKRLDMEVGGAGCCVYFNKIEDLALDVIAETIRRVPVREYLEHRASVLAKIGKGPDGRAKSTVAKGAAGKKQSG